jgi:predicted RNA binding protein YcfA (HicA-like mRNA interferase family)
VSRLPVFSGRDLVKVLVKLGYAVDRQRGSHIILRHSRPPYRRLVVPDHDEIAKGTLRALLRDAGLTADDLQRLTKS